MDISSGLFDHMVLQRTAHHVSDALIGGSTSAAGDVQVRVTAKNRPVPGFAGRTIGRAVHGEFSARLVGVPVGGPYEMTLSIVDRKTQKTSDALTVRDVLVGDVWIIAGQSNAQGYGLLADRAKPHPMCCAFYMDDRWAVAQDPINHLADSIDQVHIDLCGGVRPLPSTLVGTGYGVAFAQELHRVTGVPQGVIASAHGGTSMAQWDPAKKAQGSKSLYGATLRRARKNGSRIAGIVWYQGESECDAASAAVYEARMKKFVASFRRDLQAPTLPFACVQLSRYVNGSDYAGWQKVREMQRLFPKMIRHFTTVPAIDLSLDDQIHISGRDQQVLGKRLAQAVLALAKHPRALPPPIGLGKVTVVPCPPRGVRIVVTFEHVVGKLEAHSRPVGFSLLDASGRQRIHDTRLEGSRAIIFSGVHASDLGELRLFYGAGVDPICNITDSAGRSLPAFGPLTLAKPRAVSNFPATVGVSSLQPFDGDIRGLAYPADSKALTFTRRSFSDRCWDIHQDFQARIPENLVAYFRCHFTCREPMKLKVLFGYDGPVKLWIDGQERFVDPGGTNPAMMDDHRMPFQASAGRHEILVALCSNQGRAWGVFIRFERCDIPARVIKKGPEAYLMPVWQV